MGVGELVQEVEPQPAAQQRVDGLGEAVDPLVGDVVRGLGAGVGVGAGLVEAQRLAVLEVRVADAQAVRAWSRRRA